MKKTTSAKALDFTRHIHPGRNPGSPADPPLVCWGGLPGLPPKNPKIWATFNVSPVPPKPWPTEKIDSRSYRRINLANAGARPADRRTYKRMPLKWTRIQDRHALRRHAS